MANRRTRTIVAIALLILSMFIWSFNISQAETAEGWEKFTIPSGYEQYVNLLAYDGGWEVNTKGNNASGFWFFGKTNATIPPSGNLTISGEFNQYDTLPNPEDNRFVDCYILEPFEGGLHLIGEYRVLDHNDPVDTWIEKEFTISGLEYHHEVYVTFGRKDDWSIDYNLTVRWRNVEVPKWKELTYQTPDAGPESSWVYVLVDSNVYGGIETSLIRYAEDVENSEFAVKIYNVTVENTWPEDIRCFLQEALPEGLNGCFLVGHFPYIIYSGRKYPCVTDLYFMDLDGEWTGSGTNFTGHTGDVWPEIWVGRLYTSNASKINYYFDKNHRYRIGDSSMDLPTRSLIYHNPPPSPPEKFIWEELLPEMKKLYENTIYVNSSTSANDYKQWLKQGFQMSWVSVHGVNAWTHSFYGDGLFYAGDYSESRVYFYQYDSCHSSNYIVDPNMASYCIFNTDYGLLAIGATNVEVGLPLWNSEPSFYELLSQGECFGAAFKEWAQAQLVGDVKSVVIDKVMAGDPTLQVNFTVHDVAVSNITVSYDTHDVYPTWEDPLKIYVTVKNEGDFSETFNVTAYCNDTVNQNCTKLGTQTVTDLLPATNKTLTFTWQTYLPGWPDNKTAAWPYPNCTISAEASVVPGEIDTADNIYIDGTVIVKWPGDADGDGHVDGMDLAILGKYWYKPPPPIDSPDFNGDGFVDPLDLAILGQNWYNGPLD